jgi:hypothetical protein
MEDCAVPGSKTPASSLFPSWVWVGPMMGCVRWVGDEADRHGKDSAEMEGMKWHEMEWDGNYSVGG